MTHCSFQADVSVLYGEMALRAQASIGWIDGGTIGYPMHASTGLKRSTNLMIAFEKGIWVKYYGRNTNKNSTYNFPTNIFANFCFVFKLFAKVS